MGQTIRVLIAEDHSIVREGLKVLISSDPGLQIAGEAGDGIQAVSMVQKVQPDVVLMDLSMPNGGGLAATKQICSKPGAPKVLVLSAYQDEDSVRQAMEHGASGFMTKHSAAGELLSAIREVRMGRAFYSSRITENMRRRARADFAAARTGAKAHILTRREHEVLVLVASGLANKEIASRLGISIKTTEKHRQQIMDKLGIHEVAGLTRYAIAKGFVSVAPNNATQAGQPSLA
jgi:DNA-binding NarL/FixJ family response regulator